MRRNVYVMLAFALVAGMVAVSSAASGATFTWSITPSPSPFRPASLQMSAVSCSSPASCFAVGRVPNPSGDSPPGVVVERWDGTTWSTVATPSPPGSSLDGVTCTAATSCIAVGSTGAGTFVEQWDGASWSIVPSPTPSRATSAHLNGVACPSATSCFAVGDYVVPEGARTLAEQWDGASWAIVPSPNPGSALQSFLNGVSCVSPTSCFAVGGHVEAGDNKGGALAERWNGTRWAILPTPPPKVRPTTALLGVTPTLAGVSCTSATNCMAVGHTASDALVERWNGKKWALVPNAPLPNRFDIAILESISCASPTDCSTVGVTFSPVDEREGVERDNSITEHWNGKAWKILPRAAGVPTTQFFFFTGELSDLSGVSCPTTTSCAAVGNSAMAERWNGKQWSLAPLTASTSQSRLDQLACPSPTICLAVGTAESMLGATSNSFGERWDGTSWSTVAVPAPSGVAVQTRLNDISCSSPTNCTAVGEYETLAATNQSTGHLLIEHWDGARWSIAARPTPPNSIFPIFSSVSCPTDTSCTAVGNYEKTGTALSLAFVERWNGKAWSIVATPTPKSAKLNGVSCSSPTNCVAVGASANSTALAETWNGARWTIAPTPSPAGLFIQLFSVSCATSVSCTAVGFSQSTADNHARPAALQWNGLTWSIVSIPNPADSNYTLLSHVACSSATTCIAVGTANVNPPFEIGQQSLLEQWDGTSWNIVATPTPATATGVTLSGVACPSPASCTAVGHYVTIDSSYTLVEGGTP